MNKRFGNADPDLAAYVNDLFAAEDQVLQTIRETSEREGLPTIQVSALDGKLLQTLARTVGAVRAVEIGTLGGYSGVCLLRGMSDDGVLHTLEIDEHHAEVARKNFATANMDDRTRIHVGNAQDTLKTIESDGPFDLVFIDADKQGYPAYLDWAAAHLRIGGIVLADNAFLFGKVHLNDKNGGEEPQQVKAMRAFHTELAGGGRFCGTLIPTGEGLALGVKLG